MTKNEIVARWIEWKMELDLNNYNILHMAWVKFRDLKFERSNNQYYWHRDQCEHIEGYITRKPITEAFDELVKGIEWVNSLKK